MNTFKDYCAANPTSTLPVLRAKWGRICKAKQDDYRSRFGSGTDVTKGGAFKQSGSVDKDGLIKLAHVRVVRATVAEIEQAEIKASATAAKRAGKLAELKALAKADGHKGLSLLELLADKPVIQAPELAPAS